MKKLSLPVVVFFVALAAAVVFSSSVEAAPHRTQRRSYNFNTPKGHSAKAQAAGPRRWVTQHGSRVTRGPRVHGHGHAAPIRSNRAAVVKAHSGPKPAVGAHSHRQTRLGARVHSHGRLVIGKRHHVSSGPRIVVPAFGASLAIAKVHETVAVETPAFPDVTDDRPWQVQNVLDATRLVVRRDRQTQQVRLLGVELPATGEEENTAKLDALATGQEVYLAFDDSLAEQDAEGITIAFVYRSNDGLMLNFAMVQAGHALAAGGYEHVHTNLFAAAQAEAREGKRGLWAGVE